MRELSSSSSVPNYLSAYRQIYQKDPHQAALSWFKNAQFGLFIHYGLYSLLGRHEWVMYREAIPLEDYEKLQNAFTAEKFDADYITDLALNAGMSYVNITSRHHDSFCLFESSVSDYTSVRSPAKRDLVAELADQCKQKGLGLFLYYSYALDWRHPYFYPRSFIPIARPDYSRPEPRYKWEKDADFAYYINFVHTQVTELLTNYGYIAGIWFDPIMGYYARPDLFPIEDTYAMIRDLQPQTLIAFKQGANGGEDFASPERQGHSLAERVREQIGAEQACIAQHAWKHNKNKHNEICDTLQPGAWGYTRDDDGKHRTTEEVLGMLEYAKKIKCNLLLNTGPLPDGSIHPEDDYTLREIGQVLRNRTRA